MEIERPAIFSDMRYSYSMYSLAGSGCGFSAWLAASHQIRWDFIFESSERGRLVASIVFEIDRFLQTSDISAFALKC